MPKSGGKQPTISPKPARRTIGAILGFVYASLELATDPTYAQPTMTISGA
ncbi:hypothetical protein ACQZ5G_02595 [Agrobacterium sp. 22-214-1]